MNSKLALFIVFAFVFVIGLFFLQQYLNIDFQFISMTQLAPSLAYIITIILFKDLFISIKIKINKDIIVKAILAIIIPFFLCSITYFISNLFKLGLQVNTDISSILALLFGIFIGAVGEEIGWRSFLQPSLDRKHPPVISSLIVGLVWGLWHMNNFIYGSIYVLVYVVFTISVSMVVVFLLKDTQYNIVISSMFHAAINLGAGVFFNKSTEDIFFYIMLINCIVWFIFATVILIYKKQYFFYKNVKKGT